MATLQKIRNRGTVLLIVVGVALLAFILGDFLNSSVSYFSPVNKDVLNVDGNGIKSAAYNVKIQNMEEVYKMETGNSSLDTKTSNNLRTSVYNDFVNNTLLEEECKKIGFSVPVSELNNLLIGNNISPIITSRKIFTNPETEKFDPTYVARMITIVENGDKNMSQQDIVKFRAYWNYFENLVKVQALTGKYNKALTQGIVANKLETEDAFNGGNYTATLLAPVKSYAAVADSLVAQPTHSEIQALYNKNKEQYKQQPNADIKYVSFPVKPSKEDYSSVEKDLNEAKAEFTRTTDIGSFVNANSDRKYSGLAVDEKNVDPDFKTFAFSGVAGDVVGPILVKDTYKMARIVETGIQQADSVKLRNIFVMADDGTEASTQQLADSLLAVLKAGGDFATLAQTYSKAGNAKQGGEVGWTTGVGFDEEYITPAFGGQIGDYFTVSAAQGINIMQIEDMTSEVNKVKLAVITREVSASSRTQGQLYNKAKRFASNHKSAASMDTAATNLGLRLTPANHVDINATALGQIANARQVIRWAFEADENEVSDVFEVDNQLIVAILINKTDEAYRSLDDVKALLTTELLKEKKAAYIMNEMKGKSIAELKALQFNVDTLKDMNFASRYAGALGLEPKCMGAIASAKQGELTAPIQGLNGVFALQLLNKSASDKTYDEATEANLINTTTSQMVSYMMPEVLKDHATIEDNRHIFF